MGEVWGVLAAALSSGLGGTSIGATRFIRHAIDPLAIGAFRFGLGFIFLLPIALMQGGKWPARNDWAGVAELTGPYGDDERTLAETVALMPEPERSEAVTLLNRLYMNGPPPEGAAGDWEPPSEAGE